MDKSWSEKPVGRNGQMDKTNRLDKNDASMLTQKISVFIYDYEIGYFPNYLEICICKINIWNFPNFFEIKIFQKIAIPFYNNSDKNLFNKLKEWNIINVFV